MGSLVSIGRVEPIRSSRKVDICLIMAPFFTPWAPPLGITILKAYLETTGHSVHCIDLNTDPRFWSQHLQYFSALQSSDKELGIEGQTKLWHIMNAHLLAVLNGADHRAACRFVRRVAPYHSLDCGEQLASRLTDLAFQMFAHMRTLLKGHDLSRFAVVGTSSYSTSLALSLFILRTVKESFPDVRTVMGGGVFADDCALGSDNLRVLVEEFSFVDHFVLGEGELLLAGLVQGHFQDQRVLSIANLHGQTVPIGEVPVPDLGDLDLDPYFHLTIEGGRSCPFQCSFCSETTQWGDYRKKTPERLADSMMIMASSYSKRRFFMADSLMNPYIEKFSSELLGRQTKILFDGYLRADPIATDTERTGRWARAGCYRVRLGIESGSARVLGLMHKQTKPDTISRAFRALSASGIRTTTYWIVGFPGETEEDFQETLRLIEENQECIYEVEAHPFTFYPYGQVGSGKWRPARVYPEEITSLTRFGTWDVEDVDPPRAERYRRLRRLALAANKLGILNIYSVLERKQADQRWFHLHPSAVKAY